MRYISWVIGGLGILVAIYAVVGRFHGPPTINVFGIPSSATHVLVIANTLLLLALFLRGCCCCRCSCKKDNAPNKAA
jgi:hypothetical protein